MVGGQSQHPEIEGAIAALARKSNVHFLGAKPATELGAYVQHYDACIIDYLGHAHFYA